MTPRPRIADRHSPTADVNGERLGRPRKTLLGDHATTWLAVDLVVAAGACRADALDGPELPARSAQDEGWAAVANRQVAVLDLPAHRAAVDLASIGRERVGRLPAIGRSTLGLDDHGPPSPPSVPRECSPPSWGEPRGRPPGAGRVGRVAAEPPSS